MTSDAELRDIATETLATVETVADRAREAFHDCRSNPAMALGQLNTFTDTRAINTGSGIVGDLANEYRRLSEEPVLARIGVEDEDGQRRVFYFSRSLTVPGIKGFGSYRAPVGRLAAQDVGDEFTLPNGSEVEVVEKLLLRPVKESAVWDCLKTHAYFEDDDIRLIPSLRELIEQELDERDPFAEWDAAHRISDVDIQRDVLRGIGLRDQAILDKIQDSLFRLPLNSRVLLQGPPGTGKTTTLIRRLGQKLSLPEEMEEDTRLVGRVRSLNDTQQKDNWVMFTPTQLLELYLREAFGREGIPADRSKVLTWEAYSRPFARDELRLLRSATGGGGFILRPKDTHLADRARQSPTEWFEAFVQWHDGRFNDQFLGAATEAAKSTDGDIGNAAAAIARRMTERGANDLRSTFVEIKADAEATADWVTSKRAEIRDRLDRKFTGITNRNRSLAIEFLRFLEKLEDDADALEEDEEDLLEDERPRMTSSGRQKAFRGYRSAMQALARSKVRKRSVAKNTRNGQIIAWLGDSVLDNDEALDIGATLQLLTHVSFIADPVSRYFRALSQSYRAFRRENADDWYVKDEIDPTAIGQLELDLLILAYVQPANALISDSRVVTSMEDRYWSRLGPVAQELKHQVVVDEATDFSPIQLASMYQLAHPDLRSFFACGDFNQRLTRWGTATEDQLRWSVPEIEMRSINVGYRQSQKLSEFSGALLTAMTGGGAEVRPPAFGEHVGVSPALLEDSPSMVTVSHWVAQRVLEIEKAIGTLPSTAVFVIGEEAVSPIATALGECLSDHNVVVKPCPNGEVMGRDSDVRVFAIEHIKGLEFEAAFLVNLDELAEREPDIFDKFLYVGATRAATYLGLTCKQTLPTSIEHLRGKCTDSWPT